MSKAVVVNLTDVFANNDDQGGHVGARLKKMVESSQRVECPPFPRHLQVETTNICNHECTFCAYPDMERPKRHMDRELFRRLVKEAFECGSRDIGLFTLAEPLTNKWLEEDIAYCREIGFEYIYISTNGALGTKERFRKLLDAGLSSVKFSVNAGDRETYKKVHGKDDFDKVIENIKFISEYRETLDRDFFLGVSFVGMPETEDGFERLKDIVDPYVDEILFYKASNQSGQVDGFGLPPFTECVNPFSKVHISVEGYVKACCNDYENLLAIENLNEISLKDAWLSDRYQRFRKGHMDDRLEGTLCDNCLHACNTQPEPLNSELMAESYRLPQQLK